MQSCVPQMNIMHFLKSNIFEWKGILSRPLFLAAACAAQGFHTQLMSRAKRGRLPLWEHAGHPKINVKGVAGLRRDSRNTFFSRVRNDPHYVRYHQNFRSYTCNVSSNRFTGIRPSVTKCDS
eukprot:1161297-Pelagomonas_calceolata.AAC.14